MALSDSEASFASFVMHFAAKSTMSYPWNCDSPVALYYANQKEGFADQLSIAFRTEATESFGFVVQKNRKDLVERLNKGIEAVRAKGIEAEIIRKWMGD